MKKLFVVMDEVHSFLINHPVLRDSDERLMANIWSKAILPPHTLETISAKGLLEKLSEGKLPSYESISRCRRKLQEECPNLRGEKWYERHKRAETVKKEMPSYQCFGDETV